MLSQFTVRLLTVLRAVRNILFFLAIIHMKNAIRDFSLAVFFFWCCFNFFSLVRGFAPKFPSLPIRTPEAQATYTQNTTTNNICYSAETIFLRNSFSCKSFRYALNFHVKK